MAEKEFTPEEIGLISPKGVSTAKQPKDQTWSETFQEAFPMPIPDIEYKEIGKGAIAGAKRTAGALGQFIPPIKEPSTKLAREAQREIEATPEAQAGATLFDVLGLGMATKPLQAATGVGRLLKTGGAGAAYTAGTTPALAEDESFLKQKLVQGAIGFGVGAAPQAFKEGFARLVPGALNVADEPTKKLLKEAKDRGLTIPISDMTENSFVRALDRVFESPLIKKNQPVVNRELNRSMGQTGQYIDLGKAADNLSNEVEKLLANKTVKLDSLSSGSRQILEETFSAIPALENKPLQKLIASAQQMSLARIPISGKEWHEARKLLNREYVSAMRSATPDQKRVNALRGLINEWDDAAYNSIKDKTFQPRFEEWKQKWTAFADISQAANSNEKARQLILRGTVDPVDLMNTIAKRRETEFLERPFAPPAPRGEKGGRPQTSMAAVGGGLDVYGRPAYAYAPQLRAGTALLGLAGAPFTGGVSAGIPATMLAGKGLQRYLYSPGGQELLLGGYKPEVTRKSFSAPVGVAKQMLPEGEQ